MEIDEVGEFFREDTTGRPHKIRVFQMWNWIGGTQWNPRPERVFVRLDFIVDDRYREPENKYDEHLIRIDEGKFDIRLTDSDLRLFRP
jgi:hypothetical protein